MRTKLAFALALALAGCRQEDAPPSVEPSPDASAASPRPAAPGRSRKPVEQPAEVQLESLLGIWRVTAVVPGPGARFAADDPRVVGSLMDVFPERLSWSYLPGKEFVPRDLCLGPVSGIIANAAVADEVRAALAPALARADGADSVSRPHRWLCGDGGSWGEDAEFQVIGEDRLAMRWPGDLTFLLERVRRASSDPPRLPPTGAFEDR